MKPLEEGEALYPRLDPGRDADPRPASRLWGPAIVFAIGPLLVPYYAIVSKGYLSVRLLQYPLAYVPLVLCPVVIPFALLTLVRGVRRSDSMLATIGGAGLVINALALFLIYTLRPTP